MPILLETKSILMKTSVASNPIIKRLENERLTLSQRVRQYQMLLLGSIGSALFLIIVYQKGGLSSYPIWVVLSLGGIAIAGMIFSAYNWIQNTNLFKRTIKKQAIQAIFRDEKLDWKYDPENYLTQKVFEDSRLFKSRPTSYSGSNLISGTLKSVPFEISMLDCSRGSGKSREQIFKGVFIRLKVSNQISNTTVVLPDTAQRILGKSLGKKLQNLNAHRKMRLVYFENAEDFESKFVVYSDSENSARKLLDNEMILNLLKFNQSYPEKFRISIQPRCINIAISNVEIFKLSIGRSFTEAYTWEGVNNSLKRMKRILHFFGEGFSKS